jgi:ABC-type polysaccharide/polyol phosphate export permease
MAFVFMLVFSAMFGQDPRVYITQLLLGLTVWGFFRECVISGSHSLIAHESYIRQSPLPFSLYPVRFVLSQAVHSSLSLAVGITAVVILNGGFERLLILWAVIPGLVLAMFAGWAIATLFSFANVYFRDTPHLLEVGMQLGFFLTPVMYGPEVLERQGLGWLLRINPVNLFLELIRTPILHGTVPGAKLYLYGFVCTSLMVGLAIWVIERMRSKVVFAM